MLVTAFLTALPTKPSPLNRFTASDTCGNKRQHKTTTNHRGSHNEAQSIGFSLIVHYFGLILLTARWQVRKVSQKLRACSC